MLKRKPISLLVAVLCICALFFLTGCNASDYNEAGKLFDAGSYAAAKSIFSELSGYRDADRYLEEIREIEYEEAKRWRDETQAKYEQAEELFGQGDWDAAVAIFYTLEREPQEVKKQEKKSSGSNAPAAEEVPIEVSVDRWSYSDDYIELAAKPEKKIEEACLEAAESYIKPRLKDPSSYQYISDRTIVSFDSETKEYTCTVYLTYSGTNSFGARLQDQACFEYEGKVVSRYISPKLA